MNQIIKQSCLNAFFFLQTISLHKVCSNCMFIEFYTATDKIFICTYNLTKVFITANETFVYIVKFKSSNIKCLCMIFSSSV